MGKAEQYEIVDLLCKINYNEPLCMYDYAHLIYADAIWADEETMTLQMDKERLLEIIK